MRTTSEALECLVEASRSSLGYCWSTRDTGYFRRLEERALAYFTRAEHAQGNYGYWRPTEAGLRKWESMKG